MASSKAPTLISAMGPEGAHHRDFMAWAQRSKGVEIRGVEPASFPRAGIGMIATRQILAGEAIVFVPASSLVTVNPDNGHKEDLRQFSVHGRLALALIRGSENPDEESSLSRWLKAMPNRENVFRSMLVMQTSLLQNLAPYEAGILLESQKKNFDSDCAAFRALRHVKIYQETALLDIDTFAHAWLLVNSRSFYWDYPRRERSSSSRQESSVKAIQKRPRNDCMALCPFIDYFNHVSSSACAQVEYNAAGFTVRSDRDYAAGQEINVSYGAHSNEFLLVEYGFVMTKPENSNDWIMLDEFVLSLLTREQSDRLADHGLLGKYVLDRDGSICFRTQCALRLVLLPLRRWERFVAGQDNGEREQGRVNDLLKERVLKKSAEQAKLMLQRLDRLEKSYVRDMLMTRWNQIEELVIRAYHRR